jgi:hypothetical protein
MEPEQKPIIRPGWLTALGIIGVILGAFGVVGGMQVLGQSRASVAKTEAEFTKLLERFPGMKAQPKELQDAIKEAVPGMVRVEQRWKKRRVALAAANVLLSALLLIGALQSLRLLGSGRWLWMNASIALFPVELLSALLQVFVARDNAKVWVDALVKAGDVPQAAGELAVVGKVMVGVAIGLYGTWAVMLSVYYALSLSKLTRPETVQLFAAAAADRERDQDGRD